MSIAWKAPEAFDGFDDAQQQTLRTAFQELKKALEAAKPSETLRYLAAEPVRFKAGDVVGADGTNWDPGSGEGVYRRNLANSAWVFLG